MANLLQNLEIIGTGDKIIKEILPGRSIDDGVGEPAGMPSGGACGL
jgi:hypothetical protein